MIDSQTIKDRILFWIENQNMSVSAFERKCGLSVGYVSNLKPNTNSKKINDILNAFPNLNREWLLTGEGEMLLSTPSAPVNWNTEAIPGISELIATVRKQADIIMSQQETINELAKRLARNPK